MAHRTARRPGRHTAPGPPRWNISGLHHVGESSDVAGDAAAHGQVEDLLGELGDAVHDRRPARHHHARRRHVLEPGAGRSRATSVKISSTRGWMISDRIWRESWRGLRPPTHGTSTVSSSPAPARSAHSHTAS